MARLTNEIARREGFSLHQTGLVKWGYLPDGDLLAAGDGGRNRG